MDVHKLPIFYLVFKLVKKLFKICNFKLVPKLIICKWFMHGIHVCRCRCMLILTTNT